MRSSAKLVWSGGLIFLLALFTVSQAGPPALTGNYNLAESKVSYTVNHAFKKATGISKSAKGKARCNARECEVLIAVPVNTFDSGDSNRDLHMLETVRAALFPVLTVRGNIESSLLTKPSFTTQFQVEFAGKTATVSGVVLKLDAAGGVLKATGSLTLRLSQFAIKPPSLLGLSVDDEVPITFESTWQR